MQVPEDQPTSSCICVSELLQNLSDDEFHHLTCSSADHDCTCQAIIIGDTIFDYFVSNCQSDLHMCICNYSALRASSEASLGEHVQGIEICKSVTGHVCTCSSMITGPTSCRGCRHSCICATMGPEFCRSSSLHDCSCETADPSSCKSEPLSHRCICINDHSHCRVRYGYHICICGNSLCKSRMHIHSKAEE